jgi:hypothetical protein
MKLTQHWLNDDALFHPIGCVKSLNVRCTDNPMLIHGMPLHGFRVHVWCVVNATRMTTSHYTVLHAIESH